MPERTESNANPYLALGVRPFINCCSVRTMHGGSLMLPRVRAAMDAASRQFVNLDELMEAAGKRLAELTGAEWGIVTCGSAAAVALASAACVAGNDPVRMLRLPFTDGWVNRVILPKNQRFAYDQAIRMVGAHIVEIDSVADLEAALREPVAMVAILGTNEEFSKVRLEEIVARVKPLGIPILVDAASEHLQRPSPWLQRGADMVIYSGGKFLRGPQTSGLLLGNKNLVQAAWRNASPHQAFGRPMKVSKEDVIGVLVAVEYWLNERDEAAELRHWHDDLQEIAQRVAAVPGVEQRGDRTEGRGARAGAAREVGRHRAGRHGSAPAPARRFAAHHDRRHVRDRELADHRSVPVLAWRGGAGRPGDRRRAECGAQPAPGDGAGRRRSTCRATGTCACSSCTASASTAAAAAAGQPAQRQPAVRAVREQRRSAGWRRRRCAWSSRRATRAAPSPIASKAPSTTVRMQGDVFLGSATDHHRGPVNLSQFGKGQWQASERLSGT